MLHVIDQFIFFISTLAKAEVLFLFKFDCLFVRMQDISRTAGWVRMKRSEMFDFATDTN